MAHYIDKDALVEEIGKRKEYYENIQMIKPVYESNIEDFNELLSFLDTLEVIEIGVDVGSPEGDLCKKTVQVIDADGNISEVTFNKAQKGE